MTYTITTSKPITGTKIEIESNGLSYTNMGTYRVLECDNLENHALLRKEFAKIAKAIKRIEELKR